MSELCVRVVCPSCVSELCVGSGGEAQQTDERQEVGDQQERPRFINNTETKMMKRFFCSDDEITSLHQMMI